MRRKKQSPEAKKPTATDAILESISDGVFTVDAGWRVTSFNRAAEKITGVPRREAVGRPCAEVFRSSLCGAECALQKTLKTGRPVIGKSAYIVNAEGERIPISISTAVLKDEQGKVIGGAEVFRDLSELDALRQELQGRFRAGDLVSRSPVMQRLFEVLPAIAASPSTVLVQGETGTGKELVARTLHALSPRKGGPFVAVNCGALPDTLLESELFGYKAGAFTGAAKDKPGRFALAKGGTLFLDEIGEVSPALQVRLLRVLQERVYEPLGSTRPETADVRVIVATNRDLLARCREGAFREDLYYRVNVVRVELPPLRRRKEDIPLLAEQFIARFNRLQGRAVAGIDSEALSLLMAYDWPGNVRELENVIERAFILCPTGRIGLAHLPETLTGAAGNPAAGGGLRGARAALDAQAICTALTRARGNRIDAARELGVHKTTLFRKMRALGIEVPERDGRSCRIAQTGSARG
ncbi:MAG TPA: sigma 54-interacting transcriptional regulator [Kiritimatiellia bacterium]|nr:sigma 54-interacting transcriptional regulator [Kiritimatiellia bacterium]HPS09671.1 sigma 54-interacting transcriptional regulator [Kiritimatiellia bacterium]